MALDGLNTFMFAYACITHVLYFAIVISILKHRRASKSLRSSFFSLVLFHYVADLLMFLEFNIFFRGRKYGYLTDFFEEDSPSLVIVPRISTAIHYHLKIVVYIGQIVFAANRLSAALLPVNYNKIWSPCFIWIIRVIQWTIPLGAVLPVNLNMDFNITYIKYPEQGTLRLENDEISTDIIGYTDMGCSVAGTVLSFGMYITTIFVVHRSMKANTAAMQDKTFKVEFRLLISGLIVFIVLAFNTIIQVLQVVENTIGLSRVMFVHDISYPVVDAIYTCQPWALVISSSVIRKHLFATFRGRLYKGSTISPTQTPHIIVTAANQSQSHSVKFQ